MAMHNTNFDTECQESLAEAEDRGNVRGTLTTPSAVSDSRTCRVKGKVQQPCPSAFDGLQGESEGAKVSPVGNLEGFFEKPLRSQPGAVLTPDKILSSLDSLITHNCARFPVWYFVNRTDGKVRPFYCAHRSCPPCWRRRVSTIRVKVSQAVLIWDLTRLLSLTLDPKKIDGDPYELLGHVWHKFSHELQRKSEGLRYIWFKGVHRSGIPHLHVLVNRYLDQSWVSDTWSKLGGGVIVDVRGFGFQKIDVERVTNYVTSYLTKQDEMENLPTKRRWFGASRGILPKRVPSGRWFLFKQSGNDALDRFELSYLLEEKTVKDGEREVVHG